MKRRVEEIVSSLHGWEALVLVLVVVIEEVLVLLEMVLLAPKELVKLNQPSVVLSFTVWLGSVVSMMVMAKILEVVVHVLTGVNIEVLSLSVCDIEEVSPCRALVLSEEGTNNRSVVLRSVSKNKLLVSKTSSEYREHSPSNGQSLEVRNSEDCFETEIKTSSKSKVIVSCESLVKS